MVHSIVNFSVFVVEDFYHPTLFHLYRIFWEVSLIITTVLFLFMLYIVLKNSKEIGGYKYFIINQLVWSYLFDMILGTWKPAVLWPFYLIYGLGNFRYWRGVWAFAPLFMVAFAAAGMGVSIFMSLFHRSIYVFPHSHLARVYEFLICRLLFYGTIFLVFEFIILVPLSLFYVDPEILRESITSKYPVMKFFFDTEPSIVGYDVTLNNSLPVLCLFIGIMFFVGLVLCSIIAYFYFVRLMKKNRHTASIITYDMQMTLFKTVYFQLINALTLLVVPYLLSLLFAAMGIR